jgi:uncharacterized protein with HEPN domain
MRVAAVELYLLVIGEAAIRLGAQAETACPGLPWHHSGHRELDQASV